MNRTMIAALCVVTGSLLSAPAMAQQVTAADYERAMGLLDRYRNLPVNIADNVNWMGNQQLTYRKSVPGGFEFVVVDAATGARRPAFDHARLAQALSQASGQRYTATTLPFTTFSFADADQTLQTTGQGGAWRCSLRDYTCDTSSTAQGGRGGRGGGAPAGAGPGGRGNGPVRNMAMPANTARFTSPDGKQEAWIHNYNIAVRNVGEAAFTVLSRDGSEGDFYELNAQSWSPDSRMIAAYRVKPGYQRHVNYIISAPDDQVQPRFMQVFYPKPGDVVDLERPVLFDVVAGRQTHVPDSLFPNAYDMSGITWWHDSRGFTFEYNERNHQVYRIIEVSTSGAARALVSEEAAPKSFVSYRALSSNYKESGSRFRYDVNDGREIIWLSERDGWKHLYLYDGMTGQVKNAITKGDWLVRHVLRVDEANRQIWFMAGGVDKGVDPYFQQLFRVNFDGNGLTRLTSAVADHEIALSPDGQYYVATHSRIDLAPVMELRRGRDGTVVAELERGDIKALTAAGWRAPEAFVAKGRDGVTDIYGIIVRPANFNPSRKYPVIENIYAGPQGNFVPKAFLPFLPHSAGDGIIGMQSLAELGFIVVQIDGMGTANRSRAFHDVAWQNLGDAGFPDRILWHKAVAAKYPSYDITRVGIYGGSAGGQNAMGGMLFHPEFYKVAVAYAGCHDNRMDKISWNEQWMGWPIGPHYAASSNVDNAWRLQGKVLLIHGELDTNVDPASTMQVANALVKANKSFDLLMVPNGPHGVGRTGDTAAWGARVRYDYFVQHLLGQRPPDWNRSTRSARADQ